MAERVETLEPSVGKRDRRILGVLPRTSLAARFAALERQGEIIASAAFYPEVMSELASLLGQAFPKTTLLPSEMDSAFWVAGESLVRAEEHRHAG